MFLLLNTNLLNISTFTEIRIKLQFEFLLNQMNCIYLHLL